MLPQEQGIKGKSRRTTEKTEIEKNRQTLHFANQWKIGLISKLEHFVIEQTGNVDTI